MKPVLHTLIILLSLRQIAFGQQNLTQEQINEDYAVFKRILEGHPALYEYSSKAEWEEGFRQAEREHANSKNALDLFKTLSELTSMAGDGHLITYPAKTDQVPLFPVCLKIIQNSFYADTDDFGIPVGAKLESIEGVKADSLLKMMHKYVSSDGYNVTRKHRKIELEFSFLYYCEFGAKDKFQVTFTTLKGEVISKTIVAENFEKIKMRNAIKNSYFSNYHQVVDKKEHFKNTINQKWPYLYFVDSIKTAVLTVNSFGLDPKEFKSRLVTIFKEIKKEKADHLIIDIRQNEGGYRANAINLYSFVTDQSFKQRVSETITTRVLPEPNYVKNTISDLEEFFQNYFVKSEQEKGQWRITMDHARDMMEPYQKPFKGKTYVLIGGKTFSAGSAFALSAKNDPDITLTRCAN